MESERFKKWISYPTWRCPTCRQGTLKLDHKTVQTGLSRRERSRLDDHEANRAEITERFTALMGCDFCKEVATISGNRCEGHYGQEDGPDISYEVLSIIPAPIVIAMGNKVPTESRARITEASALLWVDPTAAASRLREAIEAVLTHQTIPTHTAKGKKFNLHERIELFRKIGGGKWADQANYIEAAKWLGNEGTHETITREEALDTFAMLEEVLDDLYVGERLKLKAKVEATLAKYQKPPKP